MAARLIASTPSEKDMQDLLAAHGRYIKLAVDVSQKRVAGGGEWHSDAEKVLLDSGSDQNDIWGGDWVPESEEVEFDSMINVSPPRGNKSREILDSDVRQKFEEIVRDIFQTNQ